MDEKNCKYNFFSVLQFFFCNYKKIIVSFIGLTNGYLEKIIEFVNKKNPFCFMIKKAIRES